ncbi:ABC transporter permease [Flavitalea flava]
MIKNIIRVAYRTLLRDKAYSLLNILGLTIGITFSLLLFLYILDELSYDRYHEKADRIFRVISYMQEPENKVNWAITQVPLAPVLIRDYPEVEQATRLILAGKAMYQRDLVKFYETRIYFADSNFFDVFTARVIEGDLKTALTKPWSMVLTETLALKYFGAARNVVGKSLQTGKAGSYLITAVIKDPPVNSHLLYDALLSNVSLPKDYANDWGNFGIYTYVLLRPVTDPGVFEKKLHPLYEKYMASIFGKYQMKIEYGIQPITRIHLYSELKHEPEELGSISYIYTFSAVAFFLLIIACINYMNLITARSAKRAKEIGVRKVTGSLQSQLIAQFLIESFMLTLLSLLLSMILVLLLLPVFNHFSGKQFTYRDLLQIKTLALLPGIVLFVGTLGGCYPAFYLASFNPVTVLKGGHSGAAESSALRKALVVFQFTISIVMLICTAVVYGQLQFMRSKDLGFNKEEVLSIKLDAYGDPVSRLKGFKNDLRQNPSILSVSTAEAVPGREDIGFTLFSVETTTGFVDKNIDCYAIDEEYLKTMGMQLLQGRNFSSTGPDTINSVIVNQSMVRSFGWEEPIGKKIRAVGDPSGKYQEVIGVIKDFHQKSLYNPIGPLVLNFSPGSREVQVKLKGTDIKATVGFVERSWRSNFPSLPYQYSFLDGDFNAQFKADQKRGKLFLAFSFLVLLITCLGILGLVAFTTRQKQKEISIRKIMGADTGQIVSLIARSFLVLVLISCLIAFPVAYYCMYRWLELFPYKSGIAAAPFFQSAGIVLSITILTVSFHTIRAALTSPVKNLRAE